MSRLTECNVPKCLRGHATGDTLYRVSPKGEPFEGRCEKHMLRIDPTVRSVSKALEGEGHGA